MVIIRPCLQIIPQYIEAPRNAEGYLSFYDFRPFSSINFNKLLLNDEFNLLIKIQLLADYLL